MNLFIENVGNLLVHLFGIWNYPTFTILLGFMIVYGSVKLVGLLFRGY